MPGTPNDPASSSQLSFLWNLVQGAHAMQLQQLLPPQFQTQESASQTFQSGITKGACSAHIEDLIYRVGAVPEGSRFDAAGNPKLASEKQINLYSSVAQEVAQMTGDTQWTQHNMSGRWSWTVSKWIDKLQDIKARHREKTNTQVQQQWQQPQWGQSAAAPPQNGWGQQPQQPQQQWGQPIAQPAQPAWGQQPPAQQPGVDSSPPFS